MPEYKDIINYIISFSSVAVTGIFSYLVWRATQKSTKVAQESYNLSQSIISSQKQLKVNVKGEFIRLIISRANDVIDILRIQNSGANISKMKSIPKNCGLSEMQIAEYFDVDERGIINKSWDILNDYLEKFWTDKYGKFKDSFSGNEIDYAITSTTEPLEAFTSLLRKMEELKIGG